MEYKKKKNEYKKRFNCCDLDYTLENYKRDEKLYKEQQTDDHSKWFLEENGAIYSCSSLKILKSIFLKLWYLQGMKQKQKIINFFIPCLFYDTVYLKKNVFLIFKYIYTNKCIFQLNQTPLLCIQ